MLKTANTDFDKALVLIHELEDQYGSLLQAPENNSNFVKIHKLVRADDPAANRMTHSSIEAIIRLTKEGYPKSYVESAYRLSENDYYRLLSKYYLKPKPQFKYILYTPDGQEIYSPSLSGLTVPLKMNVHSNRSAVKNKAKQLNCYIKKSYKIWKNVPDGVKYVLPNKQLYIKRGIDSFAQISA